MIKHFIYFLLIGHFFVAQAQQDLSSLLEMYNDETIPYISVDDLNALKDQMLILDAREINEYQVSHISNAVHVGYKEFSLKEFLSKNIDKEAPIAVYCSLGVRSEDVSEKLKRKGYVNVFNVYGGIFEWKNKNYEVVDSTGNGTNRVHAFSKEWGKWLLKGIKVY